MNNKENIEEQEFETLSKSPILISLATSLSYEDAKILSKYKTWKIIEDI